MYLSRKIESSKFLHATRRARLREGLLLLLLLPVLLLLVLLLLSVCLFAARYSLCGRKIMIGQYLKKPAQLKREKALFSSACESVTCELVQAQHLVSMSCT